jgi:two-component system, NtrC family, sensor kinase
VVRLGVSAKIFLAYAVLLVAFAASSVLSVVYLHRGRQEMLADQHRRQIQYAVQQAATALGEFSSGLKAAPKGAPANLTARVGRIKGVPSAREQFQVARRNLQEYLAEGDPDARRLEEFERYRSSLDALEHRLDDALANASDDPAAESSPERALPALIAEVLKLATFLKTGSVAAAKDLVSAEQRAVSAALLLGGLGLLAAVGAALFMLRTLKPLRVLRMHARQIAGGDYGRRISVDSRDEIGDLAREFDAMGRAIQEREQRLIRSERLATVGRMAAQITHEIRNPLASLGLYVELLGDELPPDVDGEARRLVTSIGKELDRLSEITETYLRFVRLPRPKLEVEDLGAIATAVLEFARAELSLAGISLELSVAAGLPEVAADENQIRQALLNLVRNAKEAMPGGGKLRVEVAAAAGQVRLGIGDTGSGIAAEHLGKIFDPFFSTKEKGTGLGLALVQQIAAEHGGRVEVASSPAGTTFTILLPALSPEARAALPRPERPTASEAVARPESTASVALSKVH